MEVFVNLNLLSNQMQLALHLLQRQKSLHNLKRQFLIAQKNPNPNQKTKKKKEGKDANPTLYAEINQVNLILGHMCSFIP